MIEAYSSIHTFWTFDMPIHLGISLSLMEVLVVL